MTTAGLAPGTIIAGQLRVERALAEGGFGAVYVATQLATGRERALKVLHPDIAKDARARERFREEAQVASKVASDHVVEVVAAGIDEASGAPWLAMELLEGETLGQRLDRVGRLSAEETMEIVSQCGHALSRAHDAGIVHRDLKPENLFVARSRREGVAFTVKVLDFGIARLLDEARGATANSQVIGSPFWMAPEQLQHGAPIRASTDVWALGLIVFRCLSGKHYWRSANAATPSVMTVLSEIVTEPLEAASVRSAALGGAALPAGFDAWLARCLARDQGARFADAGEAVEALSRVLGGGVSDLAIAPTMASAVPLTRAIGVPAPTRALPAPARATRPIVPLVIAAAALAAVGLVVAAGVATFALTRLSGDATGSPSAPPSPAASPSSPLPPSAPTSPPSASPPAAPGPAAEPARPARVVATALQVRGNASCARLEGGSTWCWGDGAFPTARGLVTSSRVPIQLAGVEDTTALALASYLGCAIDAHAIPHCWGIRVTTPLGESSGAEIAEIGGLEGVVQIVGGVRHVCARVRSGHVECVGDGSSGALGDGTFGERTTPARVVDLDRVVEIAAGGMFDCARLEDGTVRCWGSNTLGELGDGGTRDSARPVEVRGLRGVAQLALGQHFGCARLEDGTVRCWGGNVRGQLGTGDRRDRRAPTPIAGLRDVVDLVAGGEHVCARVRDGTVWCWGLDLDGHMIGPGDDPYETRPRRVDALQGVTALALGAQHGCAIRPGGEVVCWGRNTVGQLGDGTTTHRLEPAPPRW